MQLGTHCHTINSQFTETRACPQAFAAFDRCIARFTEGESEADVKRRHNTFKLIPKVTKGSWVIRNAVGSTPVLLGKKLTTKYFRWATAYMQLTT